MTASLPIPPSSYLPIYPPPSSLLPALLLSLSPPFLSSQFPPSSIPTGHLISFSSLSFFLPPTPFSLWPSFSLLLPFLFFFSPPPPLLPLSLSSLPSLLFLSPLFSPLFASLLIYFGDRAGAWTPDVASTSPLPFSNTLCSRWLSSFSYVLVYAAIARAQSGSPSPACSALLTESLPSRGTGQLPGCCGNILPPWPCCGGAVWSGASGRYSLMGTAADSVHPVFALWVQSWRLRGGGWTGHTMWVFSADSSTLCTHQVVPPWLSTLMWMVKRLGCVGSF